jgi:hypothetical protein
VDASQNPAEALKVLTMLTVAEQAALVGATLWLSVQVQPLAATTLIGRMVFF